jgi:undecaprenyl-diphosphatase
MDLLKHTDYALFDFINHTLANPVFDFLMPLFRNPYTWVPLYIFLAIHILRKYRKNAWIYVCCVLLAFAISDYSAYHFLKPFFARIRPCHNQFVHARLVIENCGGNWGFPSSHAANHLAMALTIIWLGFFNLKWANGLLMIWPVIIGFAQVYVGVHYPADIFGGFIFGGIIAMILRYGVWPVLKRLDERN